MLGHHPGIRKAACGLALTTSPTSMANPSTAMKRTRVFPGLGAVTVVSQDHTGKVWIGRGDCRDKFWYYADGTLQSSIRVDLNGSLRKMLFDREGRMWLCTTNGALYQDGDGFSRFTPADGLPHSAVKAIFHDREHQFWFATRNGVGLYDAHSINVFDPRANIARNVSEVAQIVQDRQGTIWVGYAPPLLTRNIKSIARFDGEHFTFVVPEKGPDIGKLFLHLCRSCGTPVVRRRKWLVPLRRTEVRKKENSDRFRRRGYQQNYPRSRRAIHFRLLETLHHKHKSKTVG